MHSIKILYMSFWHLKMLNLGSTHMAVTFMGFVTTFLLTETRTPCDLES